VTTTAVQNGHPAADCPPTPVRVTKSLLGYGGVGFLGLITACLVLAWQFRRLRQLTWTVFSLVTGVVLLAAFAGIATGGAPSSAGVLAFTGAVSLASVWLALVSAHLYRRASIATA
jgi:uncharacterized membrane protein YhhN